MRSDIHKHAVITNPWLSSFQVTAGTRAWRAQAQRALRAHSKHLFCFDPSVIPAACIVGWIT